MGLCSLGWFNFIGLHVHHPKWWFYCIFRKYRAHVWVLPSNTTKITMGGTWLIYSTSSIHEHEETIWTRATPMKPNMRILFHPKICNNPENQNWFIITLQEINISHLGKRKIIFKYALSGGYVNSLEGSSWKVMVGKWSFPLITFRRPEAN